MNRITYDISLLLGVLLVFTGASLWNLPAALAITGALIIILTLIGAVLFSPRKK